MKYFSENFYVQLGIQHEDEYPDERVNIDPNMRPG